MYCYSYWCSKNSRNRAGAESGRSVSDARRRGSRARAREPGRDRGRRGAQRPRARSGRRRCTSPRWARRGCRRFEPQPDPRPRVARYPRRVMSVQIGLSICGLCVVHVPPLRQPGRGRLGRRGSGRTRLEAVCIDLRLDDTCDLTAVSAPSPTNRDPYCEPPRGPWHVPQVGDGAGRSSGVRCPDSRVEGARSRDDHRGVAVVGHPEALSLSPPASAFDGREARTPTRRPDGVRQSGRDTAARG